MLDYRKLSKFHQDRIDDEIKKEIEPKHHINRKNGFEWDEPEYTRNQIRKGNYCAKCWMIYYNCLCSHD